eukprot:CAMPEP_0197193888 /NCGR_PEP_ID=MMETSP1423-20130617/28191_1 /TAXON_ID=476441 /ORGANISM="Pseudo-nitzschia heimii, Strain UNC1101" /LENGTH=131 /DNA_ID=CAMNT_0042647211 /DNA_START=26 /DNA_END=420 /DNA_ORIENTATION=+
MAIDQKHKHDGISSSGILAADRQEQDLSSKSNRTEDQQISKHEKADENDEDSDSGSMTLPLFMDGLPKNFATNPQLAAIASFLNDDEDVKEGDDDKDITNEDKNAARENKKCIVASSVYFQRVYHVKETRD